MFVREYFEYLSVEGGAGLKGRAHSAFYDAARPAATDQETNA